MSTEIKNTLFRFVTMRAPELSDEKLKDKRFIYRNEAKEGAYRPFDLAVATRENQTKWNAIAQCEFEAYQNEDQVKALNEKLHDLSVWIARNKHSFTTEELILKIKEVDIALDENQVNELWNNLFYQVVTQKSFYIKEAIMQILVANHVFENRDLISKELDLISKKSVKNPIFDTELIKYIINAKVVLPRELFTEEEVNSTSNESGLLRKADEEQVVESAPSTEMIRVQKVSNAQIKIQQFETLKKEIEKLEKKFRREYQKAFDEAEKEHEARIKPLLEKYNEEVRSQKESWCSVRDPKVTYDLNDPCNQLPVVPQPELPKFEFEFKNEMDFDDLQKNLSEESFNTLLDLLEIETVEEKDASFQSRLVPSIDSGAFNEGGYSYSQTYSQIENSITQNTQVVVNNTPNQGSTVVSYNGVIIPVTNAPTAKAPFSFQACPSVIQPRTVVFYLTVEVPDASWVAINSGSYCTVTNNGGDNTGGLFVESRTGNTITLRVQNTVFTSDQNTVSKLEGVVAFSNGVKKSFLVPSSPSSSIVKSCFSGTLSGGTDIDETNPTELVAGFVPSGFGVKQLGIADYKKVEQTTQGYIEGDVAHIENVMARERREKSTRKLTRSEITETESTDSEREQITDTSTTNRFELQSEVAKVLQETKDKNISAHVDGSYGPISFGVAGSLATHSSKEESNKQAMTHAQEITAKATDRIVSKVHNERVAKMIEEFEENNLHEFDNRKGDKHVVGVYRWVDKVFKNQIYNFGKRLMFEFMIPEPAKLHLLGMAENQAQSSSTTLVKPVDPRTYADAPNATVLFNLKDYSKINDTTVKYWSSKFNVEIPEKQEDYIICGESFSVTHDGTSIGRHEGNAGAGKIELPEGYVTTEGYINFTAGKDNDTQIYSGFLVSLGKVNKYFSGNYGGVERDFTFSLPGYVGKVPVSYTMANYFHGNVNASVKCELTAEAKARWQKETFKAIIDAYEDALKDYNTKLAEENAKGVKIKGENPGFYRQIENMILRKNCISYIIDQNQTAQRTYGKSMSNGQTTFGNYEVQLGAELDDYAAFAKFIEQAFEWEIMSYNFYPYYWGDRQDWSQLYQYDNNDPLFRHFMQAGMARVIVTVRPGFEEAVRYYMQTGQIWNGGEVPVIDDELFLSIVDELRQPEGKKEGKAWPTRLPTSLTILQAQTIGLNVTKALPFDEDLSDFENTEDVPHSNALDITNAEIGGGLNLTSAKLVGRIEGNESIEAKIVLKNVDGSLRNLDYCDESGSWEISGIPAGKYELLLDAEDDFPSDDFDVLEGSKALTVELENDQTLEVNLKLQKII